MLMNTRTFTTEEKFCIIANATEFKALISSSRPAAGWQGRAGYNSAIEFF